MCVRVRVCVCACVCVISGYKSSTIDNNVHDFRIRFSFSNDEASMNISSNISMV